MIFCLLAGFFAGIAVAAAWFTGATGLLAFAVPPAVLTLGLVAEIVSDVVRGR